MKLVGLTTSNQVDEERPTYGEAPRTELIIQRIVRNTELAIHVKELYDYTCQVCQTQVTTSAGLYAEAAHIQPLGRPHNGPDVLANLLCLCPNHHVMFDFGGFGVADDLTLVGLAGRLYQKTSHRIDRQFLTYHRDHFLMNS